MKNYDQNNAPAGYTVLHADGSRTETETLAEAIAAAARSAGTIEGEDERALLAKPADCHEAARLLGLDGDPDAADMDQPIDANVVARDLADYSRIKEEAK
jgi:uncharacterized membrane protein YebE (DUF533 family)